MAQVIGVDIGGTFTDFVRVSNGQISVYKRLTTPDDPAEGLLAGLAEMGTAENIVHGSTIATNALLEYRGAKTALITTEGFGDVLAIGRQNRDELYALVPKLRRPYVPAGLRFEVRERLRADGTVHLALDEEHACAIIDAIAAVGVESIAICLLFSFANPQHEQRLAELLPPDLPVTLSSDLIPEYREYERTSTTVINAYVRPLMERYLGRVQANVEGRLRVMQSNGGMISAEVAGREAARTALSGPAGGVVGAFEVAKAAGFEQIITFDMGGTSTDVALVPGRLPLTTQAAINGFPLRLPVVDLHTVGAGGGSIARVDAGGALRVGPESAGADPGPACYGKGIDPTTSDANLLTGRLQPGYFLGGRLQLDVERARDTFSRLAAAMTVDGVDKAAQGVLHVANATMERAIRRISVERGYDPRGFTLVAFGGAGPLHACDLAGALGIKRVLVPHAAGVLSALGMTLADIVKDYVTPLHTQWGMLNEGDFQEKLSLLTANAEAELTSEGVEAYNLRPTLDMRYKGQSHEVNVSMPGEFTGWPDAFHAEHKRLYGYARPEHPVEAVALRLRAVGQAIDVQLPTIQPHDNAPYSIDTVDVWFPWGKQATSLFRREDLYAGHSIEGPALVVQLDTTVVIPPAWAATVDRFGNLIIEPASG